VGFEPTEALTSHAFEACSFGRSDTPPHGRLQECRVAAEIVAARSLGATSSSGAATALEEAVQQFRAFIRQDTGHDLGPMVQAAIT
jgi:hypothetical protein